MSAPENNEYWKLRKSHGRPRKYETPEELWEAACAYFEWATKTPIMKTEISAGKKIETKRARPFLKKALCVHLGISLPTFEKYKESEDLSEIAETIDEVIWVQKFEGAAVGIFSPSIITRELGLADKRDVSVSDHKISFLD